MEITHRPLREITFNDVAEFCATKSPEGFQLDYKKDLSDKGLKKHFASFSNAHGGLIIIGVEEDAKTGLPKVWGGVSPDGKLEDRIHQFASNIDPLPNYEVHTTEPDQNGNVFVLVRILEGDLPPYYVFNDANIYIRTGNITSRCEELASPQETARLFKKRALADQGRELQLDQAEHLYTARLQEFKQEFSRRSQKELLNIDPSWKPSKAVLRFTLQPSFPNNAFVSPQTIHRAVTTAYSNGNNGTGYYSWICNRSPRSIPAGVMLEVSSTAPQPYIQEFQTILANGLGFGVKEMINYDEAENAPNSPTVKLCIEDCLFELSLFLNFMRDLYNQIGYTGVLHGQVKLDVDNNVRGALLQKHYRRNCYKNILQIPYCWPYVLNTSTLNNTEALKLEFINLFESIAWSLGWADSTKQEIVDAINAMPLFRKG